jgi:diguanylate cyclase (GGDEF)-like protein
MDADRVFDGHVVWMHRTPVFTLRKMTYASTDSYREDSEKKMVKQLDTLHDQFVEHVWWATALFCAVLLVSVPLRVYHLASEWNWVNLFFVIVPLATLIAFRFRHRYSPAVRTLLPLALQLLGGMTGVLGVGLMGASVTFLVLSNVVVAMLLSRQQVHVVFGLTVAVMLIAAAGFVSGRFPLPYDPHLFPTSISSWVHSVLIVSVMTFVLIRGITDYRHALQNMTAQLIEQNERIIQQKRLIEYQATHDELTGLPKMRWLRERLDVELSRARREKKKVAVLFIDLDGFKLANDTHGHDAGDHLLRVISRRLSESIRAADLAARMGGDEFIVVACGLDNVDEAKQIAQKLRDVAGLEVPYNNRSIRVGASIGVSVFPDDAQESEELITLADKAMYVVKREGRSRAVNQVQMPS